MVFWDFDGTLAARDGLWRGALLSALDVVSPGHPVTLDMIRAGLRSGTAPGFPWHRPDEPHLHLGTATDWWAALTPLMLAAYEHAGVEAEVSAAAARLVRRVYTDPRHWTVFPDTRPALDALRAAGYRNIVVSNHVPELPDLVQRLGLADLLDEVLTSAATGYEKPNPAMFRLALAAAGNPSGAWMVGDNPRADIEGAQAVGIRALLVRTGVDPDPGRGLDEAVRTILGSPPPAPPG